MRSFLDAALAYAELGYPVFPCIPGSKKPLTEHGFQDATTDPETIRAWWTQTPDANIGMPTQGLLVVDVDGANNAWLERDPDLAMSLARGPVSLTPRGGRHHIYRQPAGRDWRNTAGKLAAKVDTRANGGYILLPPSIVDGKPYQFLPGSELDEILADLPEPPGWLVESLEANGSARLSATPLGMAGNAIPPGVRNDTLARLAGSLRRIGMGASEIAGALERTNAERCRPPLPDAEMRRIVASVCRYEPDQISVALVEGWAAQDAVGASGAPSLAPKTLRQLRQAFPSLRPPVIEGLLREGEIMNIISAPKIGKSWLVTDLALAVATGGKWLGMPCVPGEVLILDNELHGETSAHRIPMVAAARGIDFEAVADRVHIQNLRGSLKDLFDLGPYFEQFAPGRFKVVILDAFYRFLPKRSDENDNGTMASLYNQLDAFADRLKCSFVPIHHTSKGNQSAKGVTDVGAGAGSQSRATDTHLILRRHEEDDAVAMEAAVRSWPPLAPQCLRWAFPVWNPAPDLDPAHLKQESKRRAKTEGEDGEAAPEDPELTPQEFVEAFVSAEPRLKDAILGAANEQGLNDHKAGRLLAKAEAAGLAFRRDMGGRKVGYAIQPQPEASGEGTESSKRQGVEGLLQAEPGLSNTDVAQRCEVSARYVRRIRTEMEGDSDAK